MTDIARRIETAKRSAVGYRNYRRARERAMTRLSQAYPETYKELLELEKVSDETTGAKWLDIDGSTVLVVGVKSPEGISYRTIETNDQYEDEGNDGGEA
jgi:predicted RNase H-like nuclease (RuvC/YqgF family)